MTDSSQGVSQAAAEAGTLPPEANRWNWGAFLLNWIWGIGNGTPIALLTLLPFVGFIMPFVLGAKGSSWAWRNKRWDSVEHFKRVQRRWALAGLIVWIVLIGLLAALLIGTFAVLKHSEAYQLGVADLAANPAVTSVVGTPVSPGRPSGSISTQNDNGKASLTFPVTGPNGSGTAFVEAIRKNGVWTLTRLYFKPEGSDDIIEIIGGPGRNST